RVGRIPARVAVARVAATAVAASAIAAAAAAVAASAITAPAITAPAIATAPITAAPTASAGLRNSCRAINHQRQSDQNDSRSDNSFPNHDAGLLHSWETRDAITKQRILDFLR